MKQLTCEMCGSTEMVKQDGFFVCQTCGMKYSAEEAKKMMIEGTVDVTGTVKVDNSAFIEKYLVNARRAKSKEDWEETEKYYNMVEQNDPTNIEAIFYSAYGKAKTTLIEADIYKREAAFNVLHKSVSVIDDNFSMEREEQDREMVIQISNDIISMANSNYVYHSVKSYGVEVGPEKKKTEFLFCKLCDEYAESLNNIAAKYEDKNQTIYLYQLMLQQYACGINKAGKAVNSNAINLLAQKAINAHTKWHEIDPNHQIPQPPKKAGCYVATCVYGSYNCPQVWTLRRYRDNTLGETWYGRLFIRFYYAISPTLVRWFGKTKWFKKLWKKKLDRMVAKLQAKGVEDTPYEDKNW